MENYIEDDSVVDLLKSKNETLGRPKEMHELYKEANDSLQEAIQRQNKSKWISKKDYVDNFLLIHLGLQEKDAKYTLQDWINFAGDRSEVLVLDENGQHIATVPGIYPENAVTLVAEEIDVDDISEARKHTISGIVSGIVQSRPNNPEQADHDFNMLGEVLASKVSGKVMQEHEAKWAKFFQDIGLTEENLKAYADHLGVKLDGVGNTGNQEQNETSVEDGFVPTDDYDYLD